MLSSKSFLSFDFGAGSLKAAEFESNEAGTLVLKRFGLKALGLEGSQESARDNVVRKAIQELFTANAFGSKRASICATGYHVFSKFVKLPPVDASKVTQIIQYEAQQNVPFPLAEVVWDYQILGATPTGELEVLLVAIKSDVVEGLFRTAEASGLKLQLVDVSPAALCNAFRFNYPDLAGCTMLLDIGAKTSNLLFFEKGKVYARSINIGANSITQDFAAESKTRFAEAEKIKIAEGFVSLGGAYEEPENPHQAAISKIARQVMTRLHIQVNQTIQFYRGQQGGSAPDRLFLAGGGSIMAYTSQFFAEKLNVPVEYFNPFRSIQIDPSVNVEELEKVAHSFGEVVGLGLRNLAQCPVELNLVPKSILSRQQFDQKKPYFIAALASLVLVVFAYGLFFDQVAKMKAGKLEEVNRDLNPIADFEQRIQVVERQVGAAKRKTDHYGEWVVKRTYWSDLLQELRAILINVESVMRQPGSEAGIWIETLGNPQASAGLYAGLAGGGAGAGGAAEDSETRTTYTMDPELMKRYGIAPPTPVAAVPTTTAAASTNAINVVFRAMNLKDRDPAANRRLATELETRIKASRFVKAPTTKLLSLPESDADGDTITIQMDLDLVEPAKLQPAEGL